MQILTFLEQSSCAFSRIYKRRDNNNNNNNNNMYGKIVKITYVNV